MAYNKFIKKDGTVMLDLTDTTVSAETLSKDIIAVDKHGNKIMGTLSNGLPIEVNSLDDSLLISENNGKVYKCNGKLYRVVGDIQNGNLVDLKGATLTYSEFISLPGDAPDLSGFLNEYNALEGSCFIDSLEINCFQQLSLTNSILGPFIDIYGYIDNWEEPTLSYYFIFNTSYGFDSSDFDLSLGYIEQLSWVKIVEGSEPSIEYFKSLPIESFDFPALNTNIEYINYITKIRTDIFTDMSGPYMYVDGGVWDYASFIFQEILSPEGAIEITENGTHDVTNYASANVNIASGGAEFNIAYGDTEPTDTTKLWVKTTEASGVEVTSRLNTLVNDLQLGVSALPTATYGIACASVGTKIYLFGGSGLNTINVFNTENNTITTLDTTLPTATTYIACASVGSKVYLFGGYGGGWLNTINVFDTETNTITTLSVTLPTGASGIACASVGTNIYLFGGLREANSNRELNTINVFNTETNTITTLSTTLLTAAENIACASVGTNIYLFGGEGRNGRLSSINVFNTETNTITRLGVALPTATYSIGCVSIGTKIYLFGGDGGSKLKTINVFNTETNTITTLDVTLPTGASYIGCASVGTNIYLFGGFGDVGGLNTINKFITAFSLTTNNILIESTVGENYFDILPNFEIGVKNVYRGNDNNNAELVSAALYKNGSWTDI